MSDLHLVIQPMAPLRSAPSDAAEMVTLCLFGDIGGVRARDRQWVQVRLQDDGYEGWIDEKAILPIDAAWLDRVAAWTYVLEDEVTLRQARAGTSLPLRLGLGARWPVFEDSPQRLRIGDWEADAGTYRGQPPAGGVARALELSERYLGAPYLWGGKALWGIDCSGLTQIAFAMAGISLPRDARDQAQVGADVTFESRRPGDLAFFHNAAGRVTHVGIVLPGGGVRHAAGHVHDATLTAGGIVGKYTGIQTHTLCNIKRIT